MSKLYRTDIVALLALVIGMVAAGIPAANLRAAGLTVAAIALIGLVLSFLAGEE